MPASGLFCFGEVDCPMHSADGQAIGTMHMASGVSGQSFTISDTDGTALYLLEQERCCGCSSDQVTLVKDLTSDKVIGRIEVQIEGGNNGGQGGHTLKWSVTYPSELPVNHKLLLIALMCMQGF
jgi:hypothetical protein